MYCERVKPETVRSVPFLLVLRRSTSRSSSCVGHLTAQNTGFILLYSEPRVNLCACAQKHARICIQTTWGLHEPQSLDPPRLWRGGSDPPNRYREVRIKAFVFRSGPDRWAEMKLVLMKRRILLLLLSSSCWRPWGSVRFGSGGSRFRCLPCSDSAQWVRFRQSRTFSGKGFIKGRI